MNATPQTRRRVEPWVPLWSAAVAAALLAFIGGGSVLDKFWFLDGANGWQPALLLLLPMVFVPVLLVPLTLGARPAAAATAVCASLCGLVAVQGLLAARLLSQVKNGDGTWYRGPGSFFEVAQAAPWHAWQAAALLYAGCGALLLVLFTIAMLMTRESRGHSQTGIIQGRSI